MPCGNGRNTIHGNAADTDDKANSRNDKSGCPLLGISASLTFACNENERADGNDESHRANQKQFHNNSLSAAICDPTDLRRKFFRHRLQIYYYFSEEMSRFCIKKFNRGQNIHIQKFRKESNQNEKNRIFRTLRLLAFMYGYDGQRRLALTGDLRDTGRF
jgi:hypothetical protein